MLQSNQVHRPQLLKPVRLEPGIHSQRSHRPPALQGGGSSLRHPSIAVGVGPLRDPQHRSGGRSSPTRHPSITVGVGPPQQDSPALQGGGSSLRRPSITVGVGPLQEPPASQWGWVLPNETPQHRSVGGSSPRRPSITGKRQPRSLQLEKARVQQPRPTAAKIKRNLILIQHAEAFGYSRFVHEGYSKV